MKSVYSRCEECLVGVFTFDQFDVMTITKDTPLFSGTLGDSLDQVEFVMALEDEFKVEIPNKDFTKIDTLAQAEKYIIEKGGRCD